MPGCARYRQRFAVWGAVPPHDPRENSGGCGRGRHVGRGGEVFSLPGLGYEVVQAVRARRLDLARARSWARPAVEAVRDDSVPAPDGARGGVGPAVTEVGHTVVA